MARSLASCEKTTPASVTDATRAPSPANAGLIRRGGGDRRPAFAARWHGAQQIAALNHAFVDEILALEPDIGIIIVEGRAHELAMRRGVVDDGGEHGALVRAAVKRQEKDKSSHGDRYSGDVHRRAETMPTHVEESEREEIRRWDSFKGVGLLRFRHAGPLRIRPSRSYACREPACPSKGYVGSRA